MASRRLLIPPPNVPSAVLHNKLLKDIILLDGGLGTTLEDECDVKFSSKETPLWSSHLLITSPMTLSKVQTEFAKAGADVILTATYQLSFSGIQRTPILAEWPFDCNIGSPEACQLMRSAVGITKTAVERSGRDGVVALSLGAYGATMIPSQEYTGDYGPEYAAEDGSQLSAWHSRRLDAFFMKRGTTVTEVHKISYQVQSHDPWYDIDILAFETLPRLSEIRAVRQLMTRNEWIARAGRNSKSLHDRFVKPYWISCVFPNDDGKLPDGSAIEEVVRAMLGKDESTVTDRGDLNPLSAFLPYAIGINCTKVCKIAELVRKFEDAAWSLNLELPRLVIYPDGASRMTYNTASQKWVGDNGNSTPWDEAVFEIVKEVYDRSKWKGILIGGCCKTNPGHIASLRKRLDDWVS